MSDPVPGGGAGLLIVGLGNVLLRDDGVGVHAVRAFTGTLPPGVTAVEVGTAVLDALHLLEAAAHVLAIDAMCAGGKPGTRYLCRLEAIAGPGHQASLHELGLAAAFRFLPEAARPPVTVLGVEPGMIGYGLELSPPVAAALPYVLRDATAWARAWAGEGVAVKG